MSEKIEKLVRMANQIADFFAPYSHDEAVAGVKEHIASFWTPRMRKELIAYAGAGGAGLHQAVLEAVSLLGTSAPATDSPAEKATAEPREAGQMASDAG